MKSSAVPTERLVVLFRHGAAEPAQAGLEDARRRLTDEGKKKTAQAARGLARIVPGTGRIFSSPYARASETARLLREALGGQTPLDLVDSLEPGATADGLLATIRPIDATEIVVVGHEPDLTNIVEALTAVRASSIGGLRKAGACAVRLAVDGSARLEWLVTPQILRRLAKERSVDDENPMTER